MELIETVVENSQHNAAKSFERGVMPKGQLIDAKLAEMSMLLERIDKMAEVHNLLLDGLNIHGSEGLATVSIQELSPCANCSRLDHIELDCPIVAIHEQGIYRQGTPRGPTQQARPNYSGSYLNYNSNLVFNNNYSQPARFTRNNDHTYPPTYNTGQRQLQQPYINQRQLTYIPQQQSYTQAPRQNTLALDPILGATLQLVEQMNQMNSSVDEIQDFVKTNVSLVTDNKKGKQVLFSDQLPSQTTANPRNQGESLSQTHNMNHAHINDKVVETTLVISSLRSGKDLLDPYKDHPFH